MKKNKGEGLYNVIAIGAGSAGLITTAAVTGLGGRAALIEKNKMGGDCLNFGCVPSKGLISSARLIQDIRDAEKMGLKKQEPQFNFKHVFKRMRQRRALIEPNDSVERFEGLGVDVFEGAAKFISPHEVEVNGQKLKAKYFAITAGSRARVPDIEGLDKVPYYTNETIFDELNDKPESMIVLGGGPIGSELGQAINRLGVRVTIVNTASHILPREDSDAIDIVSKKLIAEGVTLKTNVSPKKVYQKQGKIFLDIVGKDDSKSQTLMSDALLVATGRTPNIENLGLEQAGVNFNKRGIITNEKLQTSQPHIFAAGDIVGPYQFTHVADYHARILVRNIMMPFSFLYSKLDYRVIPWATYTSPEVARVGLNESDAKKQNIDYDIFKVEFSDVDRAIVENKDEGFAKVLTRKGTDVIIGVTIVGDHAGDLLHELVLAMKHNIGLSKISSTIHAYPTFAEIARKLGDQYNKTRLTPRAQSIFKWLFDRQLK